jgi:hypothetical protein
MAHATALKPIFMGQIRTAEVHAWMAIAQLAQKRLMETAILVLAGLFQLPEAFAKNVELESFPAGEAPTVQVVLQEEFQRRQVVQLVNHVGPEPTKVRINSAKHAREALFPEKAARLAVHVRLDVLLESPGRVNNVLVERFLLMEAVSVAAALLESILGQEAAAVPNVRQEQSHRLQAAVRVKLAVPERMKLTGKSVTHAHKAKFLQWQAVQLAAHVMLAVLQKRP